MSTDTLFAEDSPVAMRQPKTDRLVLARLLKESAMDKRLDLDVIKAAHSVILKWADLEKSGRLAKLKETQIQGDFLAEVFGEALQYTGPIDEVETWHRIQHPTIGGQTPDAILGFFQKETTPNPLAVIELKGPTVHLDRDRSNGRTAVDQCWDYLVNTAPQCRWGIVSNFVSFRLYERSSTKRVYEHFSLRSLRDFDTFRLFYALFHRQGLIDRWLSNPPRAEGLLKRSRETQREVGAKLYDAYSYNRTRLISYLHKDLKHPLDEAIEMAQRLFDRIMFIAFCEDRKLLPPKTIHNAYKVAGFSAAQNPQWQSFKSLFRFIDQGSSEYNISKYNGGLFAPHAVDDLELPDKPWTTFFNTISTYDFADEVNLDVLGHLFEKSITELEKLKQSGMFGGDAEKAQLYASMPQSAKRKQLGVYYTPAELTSLIVQYTVEELIVGRFADLAVEFKIDPDEAKRGVAPDDVKYWQQCLEILRSLKIVDPACGSGAFLFQAYNVLEARYNEVIGHLENGGKGKTKDLAAQIPQFILQDNLYGVDLSPEAVEITQLALWIRSAMPGQTLAVLSENIVHGNSLVHDNEIHPAGFDWQKRFPEVFNRKSGDCPDFAQSSVAPGDCPNFAKSSEQNGTVPLASSLASDQSSEQNGTVPLPPDLHPATPESGFDCVIGNPPWERIKLQEREFFSLPAPEIATATNAAKRRKLVTKLESDDPALYERYEQALESANSLLTYCRKSNEYPLAGKGDINTYAVFAELAYNLVAPSGRVGLLTPSGIASDKTTKDFFAAIAETDRLVRLYDFENKKIHFPEVHASFKFCILNFSGSAIKNDHADFAFFIHHVEELEDDHRHISLSGDDIKLLNPNTRTCPIFRSRRDAELTKKIYRRVPILIDINRKGPTGNPWGIKFKTMFHQTNDAELFHEADTLKAEGFKLDGNRWVKGKKVFLPVYEAKMVQAYDHRAADVVTEKGNWVRQGQTEKTTLVGHQNPERLAIPRFWVKRQDAESELDLIPTNFLCFKDVTSPTNQRTMIAAMTPFVGVVNSAPLVFTTHSPHSEFCLLANFSTYVYDFVMRKKISNLHLNFFIVEQIPTLPPDTYQKPCPWQRNTTLESWISQRVLKLTCTAEDMLPLAEACDFTAGSFQKEYGGRLNKWDETERAVLMAELDAAYFHLYGIDRDDAEYILSTFKGIHEKNSLLPGSCSTAELIIQKYAEMSFAG